MPALSPRQKELLQAALHDETMRGTALRLGISPHTARSHWREIFRRFEPTLEAAALPRTKQAVVVAALGLGFLSFADLGLSPRETDSAHDP